jgi:hypothetical protein
MERVFTVYFTHRTTKCVLVGLFGVQSLRGWLFPEYSCGRFELPQLVAIIERTITEQGAEAFKFNYNANCM